PAVGEHHAPTGLKLVAFGVSAEIVVVIENQDSCVLAGLFSEEVCGREPADAAADHDEVIGLAGVCHIAEAVGAFAVAQAVCVGKRAIMIAAYSLERGWIVIGGVLWGEFVKHGCGKQLLPAEGAGDQGCACSDGDTV